MAEQRLINADLLEKAILESKHNFDKDGDKSLLAVVNYCDKCEFALKWLSNAPTVDATPLIHAHWGKLETDGFYRPHYYCSNCGDIAPYRSNFCGECGALMDEEGDEDG